MVWGECVCEYMWACGGVCSMGGSEGEWVRVSAWVWVGCGCVGVCGVGVSG